MPKAKVKEKATKKVNTPTWAANYAARAATRNATAPVNTPSWAQNYANRAAGRNQTTVDQATLNAMRSRGYQRNPIDYGLATNIVAQRQDMAAAATPQTAIWQAQNMPTRQWLANYVPPTQQPRGTTSRTQPWWGSMVPAQEWLTRAQQRAANPIYGEVGRKAIPPSSPQGYTQPPGTGMYGGGPGAEAGGGYAGGYGQNYTMPVYPESAYSGNVYSQGGRGVNPMRTNVPRWWHVPTSWRF